MAVQSKKHQSTKHQQSQTSKNSNQRQKGLQNQQPQQEPEPQPINIDELAKEKVSEIEKSLDSITCNNSETQITEINTWFSILKQIITAADLHRTHDGNEKTTSDNSSSKLDSDESIYADYSDDHEQFNAVDLTEQFASNSVKWTIRVQAFKIVHRLVEILASLNLANSKSALTTNRSNLYLLDHLPDLVRLSFVAATSPYDDLKIQGFMMFKFIIKKFANVEEKELKGQPILGQYRAQILSALKSAFDLDAPPYIAAIASQVCSLWISLGLDGNLNDLKRTYQLFLASVDKLEQQSINQHSKLYTESELEQERLDILGSWAHILIACHESNLQSGGFQDANSIRMLEDLSQLVDPSIESLIDKWWEALRDYALLIMPAPRLINSSHENDMVYTREVALRLFHPIWPRLTLATTIWLCRNHDQEVPRKECDKTPLHLIDPIRCSKFICGIIMKELCDCLANENPTQRPLLESTVYSVKALNLLLENPRVCSEIIDDTTMTRELYLLIYEVCVNNFRDQNRALFKRCMDRLFSASLSKVSTKSVDAILYGAAKLVLIVEHELKHIQAINDEKTKESTQVEHKARFLIALGNLTTALRLQFEHISQANCLLTQVIETFKRVIEFEADCTIGIVLTSQLRELYTNIRSHNQAPVLITQIYPSKLNQLSRSLTSLVKNRIDKKPSQLPMSFEAYLKSMLSDLELCADVGSRKNMSTDLVVELLKSLDKVKELCSEKEDINSSAVLEKKRDLFGIILKPVKEIRMTYGDDITASAQEQIEAAMRLQQEIDERLAKMNKSKNNNAQEANSATRRNRSSMKITLKADFSNFYAQKL